MVWLVALSLGCQRQNDVPAPAEATAERVQRGDLAVVEQTAASFVEARVISVQADRVTVQPDVGTSSFAFALADIYPLPARGPRPSAGGVAICRSSPKHWVPCRVASVESDALLVTLEGRTERLPNADVLSASALTRLNLERFFDVANKRSAFLRSVHDAGRPRAPDGWQPTARERVVVEQESGWFSATIRDINKTDVRVEWMGEDRVTEVTREALVPEPPYPVTLARGDFALARPARSSLAWAPMRVSAVTGPDALTVMDIEGQERSVTVRDLVPLISDRPRASDSAANAP